jgi:hypothetical protein
MNGACAFRDEVNLIGFSGKDQPKSRVFGDSGLVMVCIFQLLKLHQNNYKVA